MKESPAANDPTTFEFAERIYDAYPLKVGKPAALRAINKQLKSFHWARLLGLTEQFASIVGARREFVPHPSTWFNQLRFNDAPSTWVRSSGVSELKTKLAAIETLILNHVANRESTHYSERCTGIDKDDLDDLKRKRLAVIKSIAHH